MTLTTCRVSSLGAVRTVSRSCMRLPIIRLKITFNVRKQRKIKPASRRESFPSMLTKISILRRRRRGPMSRSLSLKKPTQRLIPLLRLRKDRDLPAQPTRRARKTMRTNRSESVSGRNNCRNKQKRSKKGEKRWRSTSRNSSPTPDLLPTPNIRTISTRQPYNLTEEPTPKTQSEA